MCSTFNGPFSLPIAAEGMYSRLGLQRGDRFHLIAVASLVYFKTYTTVQKFRVGKIFVVKLIL